MRWKGVTTFLRHEALSHAVLSHAVLSHAVLSHAVLSYAVQSRMTLPPLPLAASANASSWSR
ncbi:pentapeptide repeat-containing protein [Streptomyces caeni]|uniref:Pentapeptide repeat-containing protein n=1 Tax=Streptomyces caeni TaxID=2307231 RepID=A0ABW4IP82_9ACTN